MKRQLLLLAMIAVGAWLSSQVAFGGSGIPTAGPEFGTDDFNTSTLSPFGTINVSTLPGGQSQWIESGLNDFEATHAGWSHVYGTIAQMQKVEAGLSILNYSAWVVNGPAFKDAAGHNYAAPVTAGNDVGGALFNLKYVPQAGAPVISDLHWIQGLRAHYDIYAAGEYQVRLDGAGATPFYDTLGAAGTLASGGGYFADRPSKVEEEGAETNPVADVQFQLVIADFDSATKKVTLYGGLEWGYTYSADDTPEPASLGVLGFGGVVILIRRRKAT